MKMLLGWVIVTGLVLGFASVGHANPSDRAASAKSTIVKPQKKGTSAKPSKGSKADIKAVDHPFGKWCLGYGALDSDRRRTVDALTRVAGTKECDRLVSNLAQLKVLDLTGAGIYDLSPIGDLAQLEGLVLSQNPIVDLGPIAQLSKLKSIVVRGSRIKDLSSLRRLVELRRAVVEDSRVEDISPLLGLKKVGEVSIAGNPIKDIAPLASLGELTTLNASRTLVEDLSPLTNLKFLVELHLDSSLVRTVRPIIGLMGLQILTLNNTPLDLAGVTDLGSFVNLKRLEVLGIPMKTSPCPVMASGSVCIFHQR